jgi:uncharacterized protein (TIGR03083 family)
LTGSPAGEVVAAFTAQCQWLDRLLAGLSDGDWDRPTRCPPWQVRHAVAHLIPALGRLPVMLAAPPPQPGEPTSSAAEYYLSLAPRDPEANAARAQRAVEDATGLTPEQARADLIRAWTSTASAAAQATAGRLVATRWGGAMTVDEFMRTRLVEATVHGLDLGVAVDQPGAEPAAVQLSWAVFAVAVGVDLVGELGVDPLLALELAAGRARLDPALADEVGRRGGTLPVL